LSYVGLLLRLFSAYQMQHAYETLKNILALIGAGYVLSTLAVGGFVVLSYLRDRKN
jgi:hypothetical protein